MAKRERSVKMIFNAIKFGNDVMATRLELGWNATSIATLANLDKSIITKYERGAEDNMKMQNFLALCNALDLDPRDYFELEL